MIMNLNILYFEVIQKFKFHLQISFLGEIKLPIKLVETSQFLTIFALKGLVVQISSTILTYSLLIGTV